MLRTLSVVAILLAVCCGPVSAESGHPCSPDGVAVGGYDLVSYHQEAGPRLGSPGHSSQHKGLSYQFVTASNQALFEAAPERYLPHYRGWCAASLAMGQLVCPDYKNFKVENGDLLLFELAGFTNGRTLWNSDPAGFRRRADDNARGLLKQP